MNTPSKTKIFKEEKTMYKLFVAIIGLLVSTQSVEAGTLIYGNPTIQSTFSENLSNTLVLLANDAVNVNGSASTWSVYSSDGLTNHGTLASVILAPVTGIGKYEITGVSQAILYKDGVNTFDWSPTYGTSSVSIGSIFGLWFGTGTVDRPCIVGCGTTFPVSDKVTWYNSINGSYLPYAGFNNSIGLYTASDLNANTSNPKSPVFVNQIQSRVYSYQVNAVPEPATLWLISSVLVGWGSREFRRRKLNG